MRATGSEWLVSYGAATEWTHLNTSGYTFPALQLGDLNGDRKTDLYRSSGSGWRVSYGGTEAWRSPTHLKLPPYTRVTGFLFGDFDGDGAGDVFSSVR